MDLRAIPVVDTHAHPFPPSQGPVEWGHLRDAMSVALRANTTAENDSILLVRMLVKQLARLLDCPPTIEAVTAARNERAADPGSYHRLLWDDANIASVLIDPGYPRELIEAEDFAAVLPCPVFEGYRIERFAANPTYETPYDYDAFDSFADLVEAFNQRLDQEAAKPGFRFYKSIIAYITGLSLTIPTEAEVLAAWKARPAFREPGEKQLRDFLFHQAALKALEHDAPFQVHTGHTSHNQPWRNANPIEMTPFLNTPRMDEVRFVLVHGGYPFNTEAGYITSVYPKVFLDLSLMIPWSSIGIARRIEETLEFAPTTKVMYGSDGIMVPELYWISAINARKALGKVLDGLTADEVIDGEEADQIARDVLHRTAERVYRV